MNSPLTSIHLCAIWAT